MAKEEFHNWARLAVLIAVIVFAGGGYALRIHDNSSDIAKGEERDRELGAKDDQQDDEIHALQLNNKDMQNITSVTLDTLKEIKTDVKSIGVEQMQMRIDMTQMKGQLNNLEGVDDGSR